GKEANIKIEGSSGLDPKEVERMRKEAESHAADDKRKLEGIEARNEADQGIHQVEKELKEHDAKIASGEKEAIGPAAERTKQAARKDDVEAMKEAVSDLKVAAQGLAQYVQGGPGGPTPGDGAAPGAGSGKGGPDDVIDAEFEVKK